MSAMTTTCPGCWDDNCADCNDPARWTSKPSAIHGRKISSASAKQVDYLVKLGMARTDAERLTRQAASDAIDKLRSQPKANPPSEKQVDYLRSLLASRDVDHDMVQAVEAELADNITKQRASGIIDWLRSLPYRPKDNATRTAELADGMYKHDDDIYKVYHTVHGANQQVAKILTVDPDGTVSFEYVGKRPLRDLTPEHKLSLEDAKAFGVVYGVCCVCSRTLTDENSIREGIGPVCASRL